MKMLAIMFWDIVVGVMFASRVFVVCFRQGHHAYAGHPHGDVAMRVGRAPMCVPRPVDEARGHHHGRRPAVGGA